MTSGTTIRLKTKTKGNEENECRGVAQQRRPATTMMMILLPITIAQIMTDRHEEDDIQCFRSMTRTITVSLIEGATLLLIAKVCAVSDATNAHDSKQSA